MSSDAKIDLQRRSLIYSSCCSLYQDGGEEGLNSLVKGSEGKVRVGVYILMGVRQ